VTGIQRARQKISGFAKERQPPRSTSPSPPRTVKASIVSTRRRSPPGTVTTAGRENAPTITPATTPHMPSFP